MSLGCAELARRSLYRRSEGVAGRAFVPSGSPSDEFVFTRTSHPRHASDMHARELVELAALIATNGPQLIRHRDRLSSKSVESYWTTSKCRLVAWSHGLKRCTLAANSPSARHACGARPLVEEILAAEVLTRIWSAVACLHDAQHGRTEADPLVRSIFTSHLEVRNRALRLVVSSDVFTAAEARCLNQLRRRAERWTDLLLGCLSTEYEAGEFGFDRHRVAEFATDLCGATDAEARRQAWALVLLSLPKVFAEVLPSPSPNLLRNREIATSVLACFDADCFASVGPLDSLWITRMRNTAADANELLNEWLAFAN